MNYTPENITSLEPNQVFVFGSNLAGIHGAGAALTARRKFDAKERIGQGPCGNTYAIPTKDRNIRTLPLEVIAVQVKTFLKYATHRTDLEFLVTLIGCGLAGYKPHEIAPMFQGAPPNVRLPKCFYEPSRVVALNGVSSIQKERLICHAGP